MQTNKIKRHAVIFRLKADHGDLEIAGFLRVASLFGYKIRKKFEKGNDSVMYISKRKKETFHTFWFNENTRIYTYS